LIGNALFCSLNPLNPLNPIIPMKALKIIGYFLIGLLGAYLIAAMVAPSSLFIEQSTTINASPATVFNQVSCFDKWPSWSPWNSMDPGMSNEYSDNPCGLNARNSWSGEKTGQGTQMIVELIENEYLKTTLVFGTDSTPQVSEWKFEAVEGGTKVTWNLIGTEVSFFKRPKNLMIKHFLTEAYATGLAALKIVAESAPPVKEYVYEITEVELPEMKYLLISGDVKPADIGQFFEANFAKIIEYSGKKGAAMSGHPTGLFYNWTDTLAKMSAAIPVDKDLEGNKEIEFRVIEGGKALKINYYGAYDKSEAAHYEMDDYMDEHDLQLSGAVREIYVTDPASEPDTSKWLTEILYPVIPM
jgi:effector-binding domain-containing protein